MGGLRRGGGERDRSRGGTETEELTSSPWLKPGDSRSRLRGFLFRRRLRKGEPLPTDTISTGFDRQPGGKNVLRGVVVSVVQSAASWAHPFAGTQRQFCEQVPARRAGFARRIPAVNDDHLTSSPFSFVLQTRPELGPPGSTDRKAILHEGPLLGNAIPPRPEGRGFLARKS